MNKLGISSVTGHADSVLATNKVLRNTYLLLGMTLMFSALTAFISYSSGVRMMNPIILIGGMYGLMFLTSALQNSPWGIVSVFAFTGFIGFTFGPVMNIFIHHYANGHQIIATALGGTGIIFFALSGYVLTTREDFSYLSGFLFVGTMVVLLAMIAGVFLAIPGLQLLISAAFMLISSGLILFQTSEIINGGERSYIVATVSLYVSIYNLFLSLLNLLGAFSGRED